MRTKIGGMLLAACVIGFCACGGAAGQEDNLGLGEIRPEEIRPEEIRPEEKIPAGVQQEESEEGSAGLPQELRPVCYDVSGVEAAMRCEGFYKLNFAAGGKQVYLCGTEAEPPVGGSLGDDTYFIGVADAPDQAAEVCEVRRLGIEMPEGMRVLRMTADSAGHCHLLWVSKGEKSLEGQSVEAFTYETAEIMEVDADGKVVRELDVTSVFAEGHGILYCFCVDAAGNYYMEHGTEIIKISADGEQARIQCGDRVEGIGCGKSGAMYCVCRDGEGAEWLCRIETEGSVSALGVLPQADSLYPCMGAGTDTELIVFHRDGGIYTVDVPGGETWENEGAGLTLELCVPEQGMPVSGQDIGGTGILGDGRVCLYGQEGNAGMLYFIPVGR